MCFWATDGALLISANGIFFAELLEKPDVELESDTFALPDSAETELKSDDRPES